MRRPDAGAGQRTTASAARVFGVFLWQTSAETDPPTSNRFMVDIGVAPVQVDLASFGAAGEISPTAQPPDDWPRGGSSRVGAGHFLSGVKAMKPPCPPERLLGMTRSELMLKAYVEDLETLLSLLVSGAV